MQKDETQLPNKDEGAGGGGKEEEEEEDDLGKKTGRKFISLRMDFYVQNYMYLMQFIILMVTG